MKKMMCLMTMTLCLSFTTANAHEHSEVNKILKGTKETKPVKKKSRRKKVMMCNECGKPEPQCECEGHKDHKDPAKHS